MSLTQHLSPGPRLPSADGAPPATGRSSRRLAKGHWVALCLGLLAFLVNIAVLRDRSETVRVAVAAQDILPGDEITEDMVRWVELPADKAGSIELVDADDIDAGGVAADEIVEGEPLVTAEFVGDLPGEDRRTMSIPIPREHAAGGLVQVGDTVDVITVSDTNVRFAASGVEIVAVGEEEDGGIGGDVSEFYVVVAVDAQQALDIAAAIASDQIEVIRSTGAPAPAPGSGADIPGPGSGSSDSDPDEGSGEEETTETTDEG